MSLVSAARFREIARPQESGTAQDALYERLLDRADTLLATWCGLILPAAGGRRTFQSSSYTEYLNGHGEQELHLGAVNITDTPVVYDSSDWSYGASDLVDSSDYVLGGRRSNVLYLKPNGTHGAWSDQDDRVIKASYTAGWADDAAPDDLEQAIIEMAQVLLKSPGRNQVASRSGRGGSRGFSAPKERHRIPPGVRQMMATYRLPRAVL